MADKPTIRIQEKRYKDYEEYLSTEYVVVLVKGAVHLDIQFPSEYYETEEQAIVAARVHYGYRRQQYTDLALDTKNILVRTINLNPHGLV